MGLVYERVTEKGVSISAEAVRDYYQVGFQLYFEIVGCIPLRKAQNVPRRNSTGIQ